MRGGIAEVRREAGHTNYHSVKATKAGPKARIHVPHLEAKGANGFFPEDSREGTAQRDGAVLHTF